MKEICKYCGKEYPKMGLPTHVIRVHEGKDWNLGKAGHPAWNRGLTEEADSRVAKYANSLRETIKEGNFHPSQTGTPLSDEIKRKVSESMKKAHKDGRAWNIGMSRWNNEPSYPEKFFMRVIKNNFADQNYERESPFFKYSLDFLWRNKKRVIEIDGEQHLRDFKQQERDKSKDKLLLEGGYKLLRIRWKDLVAHPQLWIEKSKKFVDIPQ